MSLLDPYIPLLFYLAVWAVIYALAVLLKADKHGIIAKPYYIMLKTVLFNSWIEKIGSRFRRGWLAFFDIGAAMGIGLLVFVIYSFINNAVGLFRHSSSAGPTRTSPPRSLRCLLSPPRPDHQPMPALTGIAYRCKTNTMQPDRFPVARAQRTGGDKRPVSSSDS